MYFIALLILLLIACGDNKKNIERDKTMSLSISSSAFSEGERIPDKYTCEGEDISPPLSWSNIHEGTQSFALISDDTDTAGGTWDHWVIYNMPADAEELPEAVPTAESLPDGSKQGVNSWGRTGYGGPCPPHGNPLHYFFKLYALDITLILPADESKSSIEAAMEGHILENASPMGTYSR